MCWSFCWFFLYLYLYTNIPIKETLEIIKTHLIEKKLEKEFTTQLIKIIETIMNQNYFQFNNKLYEQKIRDTNGLFLLYLCYILYGIPLFNLLAHILYCYFSIFILCEWYDTNTPCFSFSCLSVTDTAFWIVIVYQPLLFLSVWEGGTILGNYSQVWPAPNKGFTNYLGCLQYISRCSVSLYYLYKWQIVTNTLYMIHRFITLYQI